MDVGKTDRDGLPVDKKAKKGTDKETYMEALHRHNTEMNDIKRRAVLQTERQSEALTKMTEEGVGGGFKTAASVLGTVAKAARTVSNIHGQYVTGQTKREKLRNEHTYQAAVLEHMRLQNRGKEIMNAKQLTTIDQLAQDSEWNGFLKKAIGTTVGGVALASMVGAGMAVGGIPAGAVLAKTGIGVGGFLTGAIMAYPILNKMLPTGPNKEDMIRAELSGGLPTPPNPTSTSGASGGPEFEWTRDYPDPRMSSVTIKKRYDDPDVDPITGRYVDPFRDPKTGYIPFEMYSKISQDPKLRKKYNEWLAKGWQGNPILKQMKYT
jgi:hypothetical protein